MRIGGFQAFEFDAEHDVGAQFGDIRFWQIGIGEHEDVSAGLRDLLFLIADNVLAAAPVRLEGGLMRSKVKPGISAALRVDPLTRATIASRFSIHWLACVLASGASPLWPGAGALLISTGAAKCSVRKRSSSSGSRLEVDFVLRTLRSGLIRSRPTWILEKFVIGSVGFSRLKLLNRPRRVIGA